MSKRIWYISQLADPEHYDMSIFDGCPGGDNEIEWIKIQLRQLNLLDDIDFKGVQIERGDSLPEIEDVDAAFLGGSFHSVHDKFDWQNDLQGWLGRYRQAGKPLFGICGGHQQMSTFLGSHVGSIENGPMASSLKIDLTDTGKDHFLFADIPSGELKFHFGNYEHVEAAPDGATVLATRPEMPAMAIDYGNHWYSTQFHPEAIRDLFARSWAGTHPEYCSNYIDLPHAPKMLKNFIERYTG